MTYSHRIESPVGPIILRSDGTNLTAASFTDGDSGADSGSRPDHDGDMPNGTQFEPRPGAPADIPDVLRSAAAQFAQYFDGVRTEFDLPLAPAGTDFQVRVWDELCRIPWGQRISYGDLAERIDNPKAVRAVGAANGRNPISIIIPCHRVVGADGSLTGYAGGINRKRRLLELESGELKLFD